MRRKLICTVWARLWGAQQNRKWASSGVAVLLLMLTSMPVNCLAAGEKLVLQFGDTVFLGDGRGAATLHLKKNLHDQYPARNISKYRLHKIVVVAKSAARGGDIQLQVGPKTSGVYKLGGNPEMFRSKEDDTFSRMVITNPFVDSWGPWQLSLWGKIMVRRVILYVEKR